jgi:chaperonin GroES
MKLRPLDDGLVIKQLEAEEKTSGGIIMPDAAKEKPQIGKVVALGPGKTMDNGELAKMTVKKGDEVIYPRYMGNDVEIDSEKYIICKESDILGIIEK